MGQNEIKIQNSNITEIKKEYEKNLNRNYFEFLYIIGRGGFGKVWKVQLKKTKETYALKEMSKVKIIDRRSEESIISERELLSKLNHPFIVNMHFAFQDFSNLYLVMDYLTGGDLRYHISKNHIFSEKQTKFFLSNIILGLEYIHSKNIIHRDIKPENLVCDSKGYVRITDFGIAKINEDDNSSETSGTPGYMSPEVLFIQNHSFPSDFFALGIIGFEFCLGYRPYLGRNRNEIKDLILHKQAKINYFDLCNDWSENSINFINCLLMRKPEKRLGFKNGIKDLMEHPWMKDVNWNLLKEKKIKAPFIPNFGEENFDKNYCEMIERIGNETMERYREYMSNEVFTEVFKGYFYFNYVPQECFFKKIVCNKINKKNSKKIVYENKFRNVLSASSINDNKNKVLNLKSERNNYLERKKTLKKGVYKYLNKSNSVQVLTFRNNDKSTIKENNKEKIKENENTLKDKRRCNHNSVSYNNIHKVNNVFENEKNKNNKKSSKSKSKNCEKRKYLNINSKSKKDFFQNLLSNKIEKRKDKFQNTYKSQNNINHLERKSEIQEMLENESFHFIDNMELNDNIKENNNKENCSSNTNRSHYKKISLDIPQNNRIHQNNYNSNLNYPIFKSKIMSWLNKSNLGNKSKSKDKISLSTTNLLSNENKENIRNNNSQKKKLISSNNISAKYMKPLNYNNKVKKYISNNSSRISKNSIKNTDNSLTQNSNKLLRNYSICFSPLQKNLKNQNIKSKKLLIPKSFNNYNTNNNNNNKSNHVKINTFNESKKIHSNGKTHF